MWMSETSSVAAQAMISSRICFGVWSSGVVVYASVIAAKISPFAATTNFTAKFGKSRFPSTAVYLVGSATATVMRPGSSL